MNALRNGWLRGSRAVAILMLLSMVVLSLALAARAGAEQAGQQLYQIYPCTKCHAAMNLPGNRKVVPFHGINLTKGAHRGLVCSNCHRPPTMINLVGGAKVYIPGPHSRDKLMETNKVCAVCHPREYRDYINLVHGNKTFVCQGGKVVKVKGYKGVIYNFHICPSYKDLKTVPARACVECHDPHNPVLKALNILPEPSFRPPPPNESSVTYGNIAAVVGGLILVLGALVLPYERSRKNSSGA
nr:hypothetical protein [Pyrodictium occultum]